MSFKTKGPLVISVEDDPHLINRYDVVELNPQEHGSRKLAAAKTFADWLVSPAGQSAIGVYKVDGEELFKPSAAKPK